MVCSIIGISITCSHHLHVFISSSHDEDMISSPQQIDKKCVASFDKMHKVILMELRSPPNQNFEWREKIIKIDVF
jgi:hypothetical protein